MFTKICKKCGKKIIKKPSEGIPYWNTKKFCSNKCANLFNWLGHSPWNKGLKGIHLSPKSEFPKGFLPPTHWKKGIVPWNKTYFRELRYLIRECPEMIIWRKKVFERDKYICQDCRKGSYLHAHHKNPFSIILREFLKEFSQFSPIEDKETLVRLAKNYKPFWDLDNGITLCIKCHNKIPKYYLRTDAEKAQKAKDFSVKI